MSEYIRTITPGIANAELTPQTSDALYVSSEELEALYGCHVSEQDIRAAMTIAHAFWNRSSLWPTQDTRELRLAADRQSTRLPLTPVLDILEASGRYAPSRRDNQQRGLGPGSYGTYLMLTAGGQSTWTKLDVSQMYWDAATGMVTLPSTLLLPMSDVRITYVGGLLDIPDRVKLGLFEIITQMHTKGNSALTRSSVGRVSKSYANNSFISEQARMLLSPWIVQGLM